MTKVFQVEIEYRISDSGALTATVTSRTGSSGENPPTTIHHDSHFLDDAHRRLLSVSNALKRQATEEKLKLIHKGGI
jgi:hypothetical protein